MEDWYDEPALLPPRVSWQRRWKLVPWVGGAVVILFGLSLFVDCGEDPALQLHITSARSSVLYVESESLDFAALSKAGTVSRTFEIRNMTTQDQALSMRLFVGVAQRAIPARDLITSPHTAVALTTTTTVLRPIGFGFTESVQTEVLQMALVLEAGDLTNGQIPANQAIRVRVILANQEGAQEGKFVARLLIE